MFGSNFTITLIKSIISDINNYINNISFDHRSVIRENRSLLLNAVYILSFNILPGFFGIIFWGITSRFYEPADVGIASAILSATALTSGIAGSGSNIGLIRFLPSSKNPARMVNSTLTYTFLLSCTIGTIYLVGVSIWSPSLASLNKNIFHITSFLILGATFTIINVSRGIFIAYRKSQIALYYTLLANFVRIIPVFLLVNYGAIGIVNSNLLGYLIAAASIFWYIPKVVPKYKINSLLNYSDLRSIIPYSLGNYVGLFLIQNPQSVLTLIILEKRGSNESGYAYIALLIAGLLISPAIALANSAFAEGTNNIKASSKIILRAAYTGISITIIGEAIIWFIPNCFLYIFGTNYVRGASDLLRILAISSPFLVILFFFSTYLRLNDQIIKLVVLNAIYASVAIGVAVALVSSLGIISIGVGILVGSILCSTLSLIASARIIFSKQSTKNIFQTD
ncbi:MAG: hypothetical protein P8Z00_10070 [Anaerolineales bacterium]|jgi:O-antigen/teichoic acid export membrane protein